MTFVAPGSYGGSLWEECGLLSAESWRVSAAVGGSTASAIWRAAGGPQNLHVGLTKLHSSCQRVRLTFVRGVSIRLA